MSDSDLTSKSRLSGATSGQGFGAERADRPAATEASFAEGRRRRGRLEMHWDAAPLLPAAGPADYAWRRSGRGRAPGAESM